MTGIERMASILCKENELGAVAGLPERQPTEFVETGDSAAGVSIFEVTAVAKHRRTSGSVRERIIGESRER